MIWIPPVLIVMLAAGCPWMARSNDAEQPGGSSDSISSSLRLGWGFLAVVIAAVAVLAVSPDRFAREYPNRVWIADGGPLAAWLVEQDLEVGTTIATGVVHGPVNYELYRRFGLLRPVRIAKGPFVDPALPLRILSPMPRDESAAETDRRRFLRGVGDLVLVDRQVVGGVLVRVYDLPEKR